MVDQNTLGKKDKIVATDEKTGERVVLDPRLKYGGIEMLLAAALTGVGGYLFAKYKTAKSGKNLSAEDVDKILEAIKAENATDEQLLALVKQLDITALLNDIQAKDARLTTLSDTLDTINNRIDAIASGSGPSATDLTDLSSKIYELRSSIQDIKTSISGSEGSSVLNTLNAGFREVKEKIDGISASSSVDAELMVKLTELENAVRSINTSAATSGQLTVDDLNNLKTALVGLDSTVTLSKIIDKMSSTVTLTSKDSAAPWYDLLTDDEKKNLGQLIQDKGDGVTLRGITSADIENKLKGISNGRSFVFTLAVVDTDGLHESKKLAYKGKDLDGVVLSNVGGALVTSSVKFGNAESGFVPVKSATFLDLSAANKLVQPSGGQIKVADIFLTSNANQSLKTALGNASSMNQSLMDNGLGGLSYRAKVNQALVEFVTENKAALINALNDLSDGNGPAGLLYALEMAYHGIAQNPNGGSRSAWNDFNTAVQLAHVVERANKNDFTTMMNEGYLNTLVYTLYHSGLFSIAFRSITVPEV